MCVHLRLLARAITAILRERARRRELVRRIASKPSVAEAIQIALEDAGGKFNGRKIKLGDFDAAFRDSILLALQQSVAQGAPRVTAIDIGFIPQPEGIRVAVTIVADSTRRMIERVIERDRLNRLLTPSAN